MRMCVSVTLPLCDCTCHGELNVHNGISVNIRSVISLTPYENKFRSAIGCPFEWCTAHTKCPPGKYTSKPGSSTAQPTCETCAPGFFKASASKSSTCAKADSGIRI